MTSPLKPLSQFCSNFMWSLLRLGERKIAKMVAVRWSRWPPCPYMVKAFKNLLQNQGCLGAESLNKSPRTGGLPKLLNNGCTLTFEFFLQKGQVCFPMHLYGRHLYGKNIENFKRPPLKPLGWCCSNFIWSLLGAGEWKIAKMIAVHWPR